MMYLVFESLAEAEARSERAWVDCGYEPGATYRLWSAIPHPSDGRGALMIPAAPSEAQITLGQETYEALLDDGESRRLIDTLPGDWSPPAL